VQVCYVTWQAHADDAVVETIAQQAGA